jgi:hypothetical protein
MKQEIAPLKPGSENRYRLVKTAGDSTRIWMGDACLVVS